MRDDLPTADDLILHPDGPVGSAARQLFSYWSGPVSWMERLSVESARAVGHDVTVYSYEPDDLARAGLDCTIADARLVMDAARARPMTVSHFSDVFRVEGLANACGTWFDLDVLFLRRLPDEPYLFGWMGERKICNAVLRLPPDCPMLAEYVALCRRRDGRDLPEWYSWYSVSIAG